MTEPTQAAKQRACDLANAEKDVGWEPKHVSPDFPSLVALARYIQQVSDCAKAIQEAIGRDSDDEMALALAKSLILPDDKPSLAAVLLNSLGDTFDEAHISHLNLAVKNAIQAIDAAGLRIVEKEVN